MFLTIIPQTMIIIYSNIPIFVIDKIVIGTDWNIFTEINIQNQDLEYNILVYLGIGGFIMLSQ